MKEQRLREVTYIHMAESWGPRLADCRAQSLNSAIGQLPGEWTIVRVQRALVLFFLIVGTLSSKGTGESWKPFAVFFLSLLLHIFPLLSAAGDHWTWDSRNGPADYTIHPHQGHPVVWNQEFPPFHHDCGLYRQQQDYSMANSPVLLVLPVPRWRAQLQHC